MSPSARKRVPYKRWRPSSPDPTPRELQLLGLLSKGNGYKQAAEVLKISENTLSTHGQHLFLRIGARDAAHAVRIGFERGWLVADPADSFPLDLVEKDLRLLEFLSFGLTRARIGHRLGLVEGSVGYRVRSLYRKLRVGNRPHAVRRGFELGLLQPGGGCS